MWSAVAYLDHNIASAWSPFEANWIRRDHKGMSKWYTLENQGLGLDVQLLWLYTQL